MDNNQRNSFRIGNDGVVFHGDKFSKIIYYENYNGNLNVRAVYIITDYDYNIHDDLVNIFDTIIQMERNEFDEELTKAILRDYQLQYKALFQRYNTKTGRYIRYPRGYYKNASGNSKSAVRTRVSNGNQQVEKEKAIQLMNDRGVQFPKESIKDGFIRNITDSHSTVKKKIPEITFTRQFKRWFGDWQNKPQSASKVVDKDGKHLVVYHQTDADFTVFDTESKGAGNHAGEKPRRGEVCEK